MLIEEESYLEHFGKKGMKWGVRQQRRLEDAKRVATGKATFGDKLSVLGKQSAISLIRGKGLKGAASRDVQKLEARKRRIKAGKATTHDLLSKFGGEAFNFGGTN